MPRAAGRPPDAAAAPTDPSSLRIHRHPDARSFLTLAELWLLRAEAEHNLVLGIAHKLTRSTEGYEPPIYLATVDDADGRVVGCAFRTPPHKLGVTRMPAGAAALLAEDAAAVYEELPAVLGPRAEARAFAEAWSGRRRLPRPRAGMRQGIYQLDSVRWDAVRAPGRMRQAVSADLELVTEWIDAFTAETRVGVGSAKQRAEEGVRARALVLWADGGRAVSLAGVAAGTPNGARVGYVYTPPELRGSGYASALTAHLSQRILDGGKRFCFLYTDLGNPTSNAIYQRLGYRLVCEVEDWGWEEEA